MHLSVQYNHSLKKYNTFGVEARAKFFFSLEKESDLPALFADEELKQAELLVLGGGSNILFVNDFDGLALKVSIPGIHYEKKDDVIIVHAGAGIIWNDLVGYCVNNGFAGIENLALIPGTAGAAPVQNIGAYGVELQDVFYSCRAYDRQTGGWATFYKEDCGFAYRDSIFKSRQKGRYIITSVSLKLSAVPVLNTTYGAIRDELAKRGIDDPGIKDIAEVVSHIRVAKLPDPSTVGNAGSFFKNPVISSVFFKQLQAGFPEMVSYPAPHDQVKLAAGWLIEQCGWKGRTWGQTGTWKNQALVLINLGQASGSEIYQLSAMIMADVNNKFGIELEREVNIL